MRRRNIQIERTRQLNALQDRTEAAYDDIVDAVGRQNLQDPLGRDSGIQLGAPGCRPRSVPSSCNQLTIPLAVRLHHP